MSMYVYVKHMCMNFAIGIKDSVEMSSTRHALENHWNWFTEDNRHTD